MLRHPWLPILSSLDPHLPPPPLPLPVTLGVKSWVCNTFTISPTLYPHPEEPVGHFPFGFSPLSSDPSRLMIFPLLKFLNSQILDAAHGGFLPSRHVLSAFAASLQWVFEYYLN